MSIDPSELKEILAQTKVELAKVIIGQDSVIEQALITIITGNHALIEGVPGVAKTLLVRSLAKVLNCPSSRIQFTPDLMPTDITGTNVFSMKTQEFHMLKGPIFTSFLLADEINRAPAKTQSALLQAMQERAVSIDREHYELDPNFTVFATQNPIEHEGTYPLPEAQKDRFMLKINMGYPEQDDEYQLAQKMLSGETPEKILESEVIQPTLSPDRLPDLRAALSGITVRDELVEYIVKLVRQTREEDCILVGAGPRATQALLVASRAKAVINGQDYVTPDDVKSMAASVLEHRLLIRPEFEIEGLTVESVIQQLINAVPVPR